MDDEEEVRKSIIRKIDWEAVGFTVVGDAENGEDALEKIESLEPDVVLTDIRMPYMDGLTLAEKIRQKYPSMKIVIFSGYDDFEYAKRAIKLNVTEYILKPVNVEELTAILKRIQANLDEEIEQKRNEMDRAVKEIVDSLQGKDAFEQEKAGYDLLCERIVYDGSGIDGGQTAYSALIEGRTVCSGYSRAFQMIMMQLGHPCSYASGQAQGVTENGSGWEAHAWNVVQLDDAWYNVDVTWGDSTVFDTEAVLYRGFNATDALMSTDHERQGLSVQLPNCTTEFDFESRFGNDPAAASLESAGLQVSLVADSPDQVASDVANRASDLAAGEQYVLVLRNMGQAEVDSALQGALDAMASAYPGRSVSQSGSTQEYDADTTIAQLQYELS